MSVPTIQTVKGRVVFFRTGREKISYNKVTVKGTAASRVFCRLKAEAVEWESKWPDTHHLGLTRPQWSQSAVSLIRSIRFAQVEPSFGALASTRRLNKRRETGADAISNHTGGDHERSRN